MDKLENYSCWIITLDVLTKWHTRPDCQINQSVFDSLSLCCPVSLTTMSFYFYFFLYNLWLFAWTVRFVSLAKLSSKIKVGWLIPSQTGHFDGLIMYSLCKCISKAQSWTEWSNHSCHFLKVKLLDNRFC